MIHPASSSQKIRVLHWHDTNDASPFHNLPRLSSALSLQARWALLSTVEAEMTLRIPINDGKSDIPDFA